MDNAQIADAFAELADRLALTDEKPFRYMAYRKADAAFRELGLSVAVLSREGRLREIDGIGPAIEEKVAQLIDTGSFPALDRAREEVDDTLLALTRLSGIGPATARKVFAAAGEQSFDELVAQARSGELTPGEGITKKVIAALAQAGEPTHPQGATSGIPRDPGTGAVLDGPWFRRDQAATQLHALEQLLQQVGATTIEVGGEYARGWELVPGLDLLVDAHDRDALRTAVIEQLDAQGFSVVSIPDEPLAIVTPSGMPVCVVIAQATPHAYSTLVGPPAWVRLEPDPDAQSIPIELRDAVLAGTVTIQSAPRELVVTTDLIGELHGHSTWSDGASSIIEMARAARDRGDTYYLVSDHSMPYAMVGGLDPERLSAQADEIAQVNAQLQHEHETEGAPRFRVLQGSEVEILADGSLGLPDHALAQLDWVVASIHVAQRQDAASLLRRMQRVVQNPLVDAIGHPTSRRLLRRARTALDMEKLIDMCAEQGVVLEINANPDRLDLDSAQAAQACAAGVRLTINCDAHSTAHLAFREHGVKVARRAGVRASDVVNCQPVEELLAQRRRYTGA